MKSQAVPSHVGVPCAGAEHGEQLAPQLATEVFEAQAEPQRWVDGAQVKSHWPATQAATWFAPLTVQASHRTPQLPTASSATQVWPQMCWPEAQRQVCELVSQVAPPGHSWLR